MKIPFPGGAGYIEPEEGPRDTMFYRRILRSEPLPGSRTGQQVTLDCGHRCIAFGNLEAAGGKLLCIRCRDNRN